MKRFASFVSLWTLAGATVFAQDPPPQNPPQDPPKEEPKEEGPPKNWPKLDLSHLRWGLRGNESTFRRYGTPPYGLTIRELKIDIHEPSPAHFGELTFRGMPNQDFYADTAVVFGSKAAYFESFHQENSFFDPSAFPIDPSHRRTSEAHYRQPVGNGFDLTLGTRSDRVDKVFEAPTFAYHTRNTVVNSRLAGGIGQGQVDLSYRQQRFFDRTNFRPDWTAQTMRGSVLHPVGSVHLEGSFAQTNIAQSGRHDSKARTWSLEGGVPVGTDHDIQFGVRLQRYDLPETINAYVRERNTSWVRFLGRFSGLSGQVGYKRVETERLRANHDFVDVPKWDIFDARLTGRLNNGVRWTARGWFEHGSGRALMLTEDPRRLYWDDRANLQLRLDHTADNWNAYFALDHRYFENTARDVEVKTYLWTIGGAYQIRPQVELYAELLYDRARTRFHEPDATIGLDSFFPSSRVNTFGANWAIDDATSLTTSYSEFFVDNDNPIFEKESNVATRFASAHLRRRDKQGNEYGLMVAPGRYADRVIRQLGFEATVVMLTVKLRF